MKDSALSLATDLIHSIPECVCIYLKSPDIIIPNTLWKKEVGTIDRLSGLQKLGVSLAEINEWLNEEETSESFFVTDANLNDQRSRRLKLIKVSGHPGVFVIYLRDETEAKRVEQLRKDFIANVSHELRTPLTAVKGYLETLLDPKFFNMDRVKQFLPVIFEHTERLHNLMLDLLSLSRLENPSTHIQISPIPLVEQLQEAVEATSVLAKMKNVTVMFSKPEEEIIVNANTEHIERILVNLLDNAIKYSASGGTVQVWAERKGDVVWTHVRDEGPGIHAQETDRVFERFYRTRSALSGKARGSGLGLAIAKHIVQQLGGEIRVASEIGKGSDFYFSLVVQEQGNNSILGHSINT